MMHCDLVKNDWLAGSQTLLERLEPTDPRSQFGGSYIWASAPHTEDACPFKDSQTLHNMIWRSTEA